jgi:pimeloyl-[acyl-carrier protein] methyl ester esterase
MPWINSKDNQKIYYKTYGNAKGKALIFIHGWIMSSIVWIRQNESLSNYKLIFIDLRGHGESSEVKGPYFFSQFTEDLECLIFELKLEKPILVGWSMGAMIALEYVKTRSSSLAGLVLVSATASFMKSSNLKVGVHPSRVKKLKEGLTQDYKKRMMLFCESVFTQKERGCDENIKFLKINYESHGFPPSYDVVNETLEELLCWNKSDWLWLKDVVTPSLIVHGAKDNVVPTESGRVLNSFIPNSKFVIFDEAGHAPFISESERFNNELTLFVEKRYCN